MGGASFTVLPSAIAWDGIALVTPTPSQSPYASATPKPSNTPTLSVTPSPVVYNNLFPLSPSTWTITNSTMSLQNGRLLVTSTSTNNAPVTLAATLAVTPYTYYTFELDYAGGTARYANLFVESNGGQILAINSNGQSQSGDVVVNEILNDSGRVYITLYILNSNEVTINLTIFEDARCTTAPLVGQNYYITGSSLKQLVNNISSTPGVTELPVPTPTPSVTASATAPSGDDVLFAAKNVVNFGTSETVSSFDKIVGSVDTIILSDPSIAVTSIYKSNAGKIFVGSSDNSDMNGLAVFNLDGTRDNSYVSALGSGSTVINSYVETSDGIYIAGLFTIFSIPPVGGTILYNNLARLHFDGTLDTSFVDIGLNTSTGTEEIYSMCKTSDGKLYILGEFTGLGSGNYDRLARLNADGTLDNTFVSPYPTYNFTIASNAQAFSYNNKLYLTNLTFSGATVGSYTIPNYLTRLNLDGTIDTTFVDAGYTNLINGIGISTDGKLYVGGYNAATTQTVNRFTASGALDNSFAPLNISLSLSPTATNTSFAVASSGKIYVSGLFDIIGSTTTGVGSLCRLNSDGTLDTSFVGPTAPTEALVFVDYGKVGIVS